MKFESLNSSLFEVISKEEMTKLQGGYTVYNSGCTATEDPNCNPDATGCTDQCRDDEK